MVNSLNNQCFTIVILQNCVKSELDVFAFTDILQVGSDRLVVEIDRFKKGEESFDDFQVGFFEALI